jgi:hypothetical protein
MIGILYFALYIDNAKIMRNTTTVLFVVRSPKDCYRRDKFKYAKGVVRSPKDCCRRDNTMVKIKGQKYLKTLH